jgi:hypothetical protein
VPVVILLLAAGAILGGVIVVAMGHGGEMARYRDPRPTSPDFDSWKDVAGYRPPAALLGYHAGATEHALLTIARVLAERDAEIGWLRDRLSELQPERPNQTWQGGASTGGAGLAGTETSSDEPAVSEPGAAYATGQEPRRADSDDQPADGQPAGATSVPEIAHMNPPGEST